MGGLNGDAGRLLDALDVGGVEANALPEFHERQAAVTHSAAEGHFADVPAMAEVAEGEERRGLVC